MRVLFDVFRLLFGLVLYLFFYTLFAISNIENHYPASLSIYGAAAIVYALHIRNTNPPSKAVVDFIYYTAGVIGVIIFTWLSHERIRDFDLPRGDLKQAISENLSELDNAREFSNLFHNEPDALLRKANEYLSDISAAPKKGKCVYDYYLYDGSGGIRQKDINGARIRSSASLDLDAPTRIISKCVDTFGGRPVVTSLFNFWKSKRLAVYEISEFPFQEVTRASQLQDNLHAFLDFQAARNSLKVGEFVEFLVDGNGAILKPSLVSKLADAEREYSALPVDLTWFDRFLAKLEETLGERLEFAIWPVLAVFLLSLKITTISKSR